MAYVQDQINLWKYQEERDSDTRRQLGKAMGDIAGFFVEDRKRALDTKRKNFDVATAFGKEGVAIAPDEMEELNQTGYSQSLLDKYASKAEEARLAKLNKEQSASELERRHKESQIYKNERSGHGSSKMSDQKKIDYRFELDKKKKDDEIQRGNRIPDFEMQPGMELTLKDRETLTTQNAATKNIQTVGKRLIDGIDRNGITSGLGFTQGDRDASQNISEMQLQLKELFNLGAITGPDMDLVNANMGRLQGPIDMLNPFNSREDAKSQIKNIINSAIQRVSGTAAAKGATYVPAQVVQKVQSMTPDQKAMRLQELRNKKMAAMGGQ